MNGYETVLSRPLKRDVCYWINEQAEREGERLGCLNAAVEATSLNDRAWGRLLPRTLHGPSPKTMPSSPSEGDVALSLALRP